MKYSVCVDAVYMNKDIYSALEEIKSIGYTAFEFWTWWDKDLDALVSKKEELGLTVAACCTKFISLTDPTLREQYKQGLLESVEAAKKLGCNMLISQVGDDTGEDAAVQATSIVEGLKSVVPILEQAGITLVIEPLNIKVDHKGYFLSRSEDAFDIVKRVNSKYVKVLFDLYHQQITEGDLLRNSVDNIKLIGHFHAAGNPGRAELQSGELNYPNIFAQLDKAGYEGYCGLEYFPTSEPPVGLKAIIV